MDLSGRKPNSNNNIIGEKMKLNCWEHHQCGRQAGGDKMDELGPCPVPAAEIADGLNEGTNGGRACWVIGGTMCGGKVRGTFAQKLMDCAICSFSQKVMAEEGDNFHNVGQIFARIGA
jgi:hypothetical protein